MWMYMYSFEKLLTLFKHSMYNLASEHEKTCSSFKITTQKLYKV